jgi:uncharacterized surface protein with fasciclin (FAS1) repeats
VVVQPTLRKLPWIKSRFADVETTLPQCGVRLFKHEARGLCAACLLDVYCGVFGVLKPGYLSALTLCSKIKVSGQFSRPLHAPVTGYSRSRKDTTRELRRCGLSKNNLLETGSRKVKVNFKRGVAALVLGASLAASSLAHAASDIVDTAVSAGSFSTLVAAVKAAGLVDTLKGKGPFTVFAPTDAAFAKLPAGTVESLLKPENKGKLTAILTYHVVPGKVLAKDLMGRSQNVKTVQGQTLRVQALGSVFVDGATVSTADVMATNGVIHVIDSVVMPK